MYPNRAPVQLTWHINATAYRHGPKQSTNPVTCRCLTFPAVTGSSRPARRYWRYTRLQTVWSLPGHSRHANKGHSPRCHRRPNGPSRLADKVVQPTTQYAEGCTYRGRTPHLTATSPARVTAIRLQTHDPQGCTESHANRITSSRPGRPRRSSQTNRPSSPPPPGSLPPALSPASPPPTPP